MLNTKKDETEGRNAFAYVSAGLVANKDQNTNNSPSTVQMEAYDIWLCTECGDRNVYLEGPTQPLKTPHVEGAHVRIWFETSTTPDPD